MRSIIRNNVSKHKNNLLDNKRDGRYDVQKVYKKDSRNTISANPERQIFEIFRAVPTMMGSQGDTQLNNLLARPKKSWIQH